MTSYLKWEDYVYTLPQDKVGGFEPQPLKKSKHQIEIEITRKLFSHKSKEIVELIKAKYPEEYV